MNCPRPDWKNSDNNFKSSGYNCYPVALGDSWSVKLTQGRLFNTISHIAYVSGCCADGQGILAGLRNSSHLKWLCTFSSCWLRLEQADTHQKESTDRPCSCIWRVRVMQVGLLLVLAKGEAYLEYENTS